jgi:hypothetical protein
MRYILHFIFSDPHQIDPVYKYDFNTGNLEVQNLGLKTVYSKKVTNKFTGKSRQVT